MLIKPNLLLSFLLFFIFLVATSCLSSTRYKCDEVVISDSYYLDSIDSGLDADDGIFAASIKLKGFLEKDIQFNDMSLTSGSIDTVINHQDQYGTHFYYEILNDSKGKIDLEICVSFSH